MVCIQTDQHFHGKALHLQQAVLPDADVSPLLAVLGLHSASVPRQRAMPHA
jgi:hypothetical protein